MDKNIVNAQIQELRDIIENAQNKLQKLEGEFKKSLIKDRIYNTILTLKQGGLKPKCLNLGYEIQNQLNNEISIEIQTTPSFESRVQVRNMFNGLPIITTKSNPYDCSVEVECLEQ